MNMEKNSIPEKIKNIHLIAVCGTAMGALASMLKDLGFNVTGSDNNVYPPMSDFLKGRGIDIICGFNEKNISYRPDLVVIGNTVSKDNPEAAATLKTGLNYCSMPQAINRFLVSGKKPLVITGTHGKTTTSSILAWILYCAGFDPSFVIGGILKDFNCNYRLGKGDYIVLEGDEYDTAFFDKGPKFLHYNPFMAVLTSVEFDHADIFTNLDHVKKTFAGFVDKILPQKTLVAFDGDGNVNELAKNIKCRVVKYGNNTSTGWRLGTVSIAPPWTFFEVLKHDALYGKFKTELMGEHNLLNSLAAIVLTDALEIPSSAVEKAFETFGGVRRRQEVRGCKNGITVMDDFAHHPTAVRETIRGVKPYYNKGRIIAVFEPRTNSSMRNVFQNIYPDSFDDADIVCIRKPSLLDKIPPNERFSSEKLVKDLKDRGKDAHYFNDTDSIIDFLTKEAKSGDLVLIMSNGGFDNIHQRLLELL